MKRFLLFWICLLCCFVVKSQTYPVTVVPTVKQPAPIYFSSYANTTTISGPLRVQILLNDLTIGNREIRLKTYFEGNGINFQSNTLVNGASPLFLEGGIPLVLNSTDLAPYFEFSNSTGISAVAYGQPIPEGSYQFCFEVFDAVSGNRISQKSCANTYIFQNEPPFLVLPQNKITIQEQNPQNIVFQWTPRHINVTNAAYQLSLVEIWDTNVDPQAAFLSSRPIFQTTTQKTTYVYGPTDPLLLSNKRYAWRVQAKAKQGAEDIGLFKNNGYSEIFWFTHTTPCKTPQNVTHEVKGMREANIYWDEFSTDIPEFTVRYREKGEGNQWFASRSTANWVTLWDLRPGTVYEYQVAKKCELVNSEYSKVRTFTTFLAEDELGLYNCGIPPNIDISNQTPLAELKKGDVFKAGDFPVKVMETSGTNGRFTGKGYVTIPYLNSVKVAVEFTNVFVNAESQLAEGMVITKYDPTWGNIADVDGLIDSVESMGDVFSGGDDITENVDFEVKEVKVENGKVVITGTNGEVKKIDHDKGDDYTITDSKGNQWSVNENGNVTQSGEADDSPQLTADNTDGIKSGSHEGTVQDPRVDKITSEDVVVTFRLGENTQYALDKVDNQYETNNYPKIESSDGSIYFPVHKAVVDDITDVFYADVEINNPAISIDSINIKTSKGTAILHELNRENNTFKITVKGNNPYHTEEAVVTYLDPEDNNYKIAGTFYIHHIKRFEPIDVRVVPVGSSNGIADIEEQLNKIYKQVGVTFNVSVEENFNLNMASWDDNNDEVITYDAARLMKDYPKELKNIIKAYKSYNPSYDDKSYYLFLMDSNIKVSKPLGGFMPKTRQWGFLFEAYYNISGDELESKGSAVKIAAHELGHGVFTLEHPFGENIDNAGITGNWLMDYGSGTDLAVPDWQMLSDQSLKLYLFQDEEDGELGGEVWFTPDWKPITIKRSSIIVSTTESSKIKGTLPGFKQDGVRYTALFDNSGNFAGYYQNGKSNLEKNKIEYVDINELKKVYLFVNDDEDCNKAYETTYAYAINNKTSIVYNESNTNIKNSGRIKCNDDIIDYDSLCEAGKEFFDDYKNEVYDTEEKDYLFKVSEFLCEEGSSEVVLAQKKSYERWKNSVKSILQNVYKPFSFQNYYKALVSVQELVKNAQKSISDGDREELFKIAYLVHEDIIGLLSIEQKLKFLQILLSNKLYNVFTINQDYAVSQVVKAVKDDEASVFLQGLESPDYADKKGDPLIYNLKESLSDFLNSKNPYTEFFRDLSRITYAAYTSNDELKVDAFLKWDVEQKDYILVSVVSDNNDFTYFYNNNDHTVSLKKCIEYGFKVNTVTPTINYTKVCEEEEYLLPRNSSPMSLVGVTIVNDVSPILNSCISVKNEGDEVELCGEMLVVPAVFLDYLEQKVENQRWENFGWNTFNVVLTVTTFGEGVGAIAAIRAAGAGTKLAVAYKNAYTLLDFAYTVTNLGFEGIGYEIPQWWENIGGLFQIKGVYDIGKKGVQGLAALKYAKQNGNLKKVIDDLGLKKKGTNKDMSIEELEGYIDELEELVSKKGLDEDYRKALDEIKANTAGRFAANQISEYVKLATKNPDANKVMLGKYDAGGSGSYIQRAGKDHTYFDMGADKWKEAEELVNNPEEMWLINKQFIDEQKALNKEFYFSHEPWKAQTHEYLSKEAEYLIDIGAKDFEKINANTWKVIW